MATDTVLGPLRQVKAARVTKQHTAQLQDSLVFWRGLARFAPPVRIQAAPNDDHPGRFGVTVHNDGDVAIPRAFLLHLHPGGGMLHKLWSIAPKSSSVATPTPKESPVVFNEQVQEALLQAVVDAGLPTDAAKALVASFTHNWLKAHGLRVIVVAPAEWGAAWFPTTLQPLPTSHTRVALGRFEVLTAADEDQAAASLDPIAFATGEPQR